MALIAAACGGRAPPEGLSVQAWRLFALFAGAIFSVVVSALADPHRVGPRGCRRGAHRAAPAGRRVRRLRQRHHPAHRRRVSGGRIRGEVRSRHARRALDRQPVRPIDARPLVLDLPARRGDRAGVSQQHGALRRALSAGVLAGERGGRDARSTGSPAGRRVPDVLGHRQPERVVGAVADGDGRQPARHGDGARVRRRDRLRAMAARRVACRRSARWRCCRSCCIA